MSGVAYALALFEIAGTGAFVAWAVVTTQEPPATATIGFVILGLFALSILSFAIPALAIARQGTRPRLALLLALMPLVVCAAAWWLIRPG